ncbi:MAG: T9SS C-terminal target domain-containing protein [Bacteroidota bacterium]
MKHNFRYLLTGFAALLAALPATGRENVPGGNGNRYNHGNEIAAACNASTAQTELYVNNVRTTILAGGDMWWDFSSAKYEIPKGGGAHSMFAGSLWIGGVDAGNQLKVAAMTYRQTGNDFWPGPLDTLNVSIDQVVCDQYDKHFRITRTQVEEFYAASQNNFVGYTMPQAILQWPGNGNTSLNQGKYLAPFYDANGDGNYNPYDGDFPDYDVTGSRGCAAKLYGDETLWWVFNDKGNIHTETGALEIGLELHAQAFGFNTNDEINNMTFYAYKVINRSSYTVNQCYFGMWTDPDLGLYDDDYVGCDVQRGLGFIYNGDADDGGGAPGTYGLNPPALGCDFFQGPLADSADGVDNDRNCIVDDVDSLGNPTEQIIMSKFVYYNNDFSSIGNPETGNDFYNYLKGIWKDGTPITYGGNGHNTGIPCNFMFPDLTDQIVSWGTGGTCQSPQTPQAPWNEVTAGNTPADRRFLQSAGPFTLQPGAVNYVTVGLVWARANQGGNTAAIGLIKLADDKAQKLFENCFQVLNGPDAPDLAIQELDKELILTISNKPAPFSNNYLENYEEYDPLIVDTIVPNRYDTTYNFEGYQIFQLKDATVSVADLRNVDKARLVVQCDVKNGITQLVNFEFDQALNANVPTEEVNGEDKGIFHSISLKEDQFATGDRTFVNHKTYYFMALAYAYNEYAEYQQDIPPNPNNIYAPSSAGQKKPYKAGRRNIKVYSGIPHIPSPEATGTNQQSTYGMGPKITRVEGRGNGGMTLELTQASIDAIVAYNNVQQITYENGAGPVNVKVIDPLNVPDGNFTLKFTGVATTSNWSLTGPSGTVNSDKTILLESPNEQLIPEWGLSVSITQVNDPGTATDETKGVLSATMTFSDPTNQWLTGLADEDGYTLKNWIRSGVVSDQSGSTCLASFNDFTNIDPDGKFEQILGGTWAPYRVCGSKDATVYNPPQPPCYYAGPAWEKFQTMSQLKELASVDVIITSDKSKWTRCPVFEICEEPSLADPTNPNGTWKARKMDLRTAWSVDKEGRKLGDPGAAPSDTTNPNAPDYISRTGMGWFPGYAINVETGERLNMAFGENSWLVGENGRDMIWNPTANEDVPNNNSLTGEDALFGGGHYIYIFGHNGDLATDCPRYDAGKWIKTKMKSTSATTPVDNEKRAVFADAMWVNIPLIVAGRATTVAGQMFVPPTDVKIRLRVKKPYAKGFSTANDTINGSQNGNNPMYTFNTSDLKVTTNDAVSGKDALELINIVPNPYYAYSEYEKNQLDNRVKITNLPENCTVSIYTLNGTLIRKFNKADPKTSLDWDLKNQAGIPVASGMYIIHVKTTLADGSEGEKVLKWFGVMRPIDLDQF